MPRTGNKSRKPVSRSGAKTAPVRNAGGAEPVIDKPAGWKAAVHEYVKLFNQAEIDRYAPAFEELVLDRDHLLRYEQKLQRLKEAELLRGAIPSKSETKVELERVGESSSGSEVTVTLRLHIVRTMDQQGRLYIETRSERERLWLSVDGDRYRITRIEPHLSERRPRFHTRDPIAALGSDDAFIEETYPQTSMPFLNFEAMPGFRQHRARIRYRRDLAAAYADRWWNEPNPAYENFEVNCTNYVSQCMHAGQAPMNNTGRRDAGWWYRGRSGGRELWSYSWAVSNALQVYLSGKRSSGLRATLVDSAAELELGDVIMYDWSGDGRFQHTTIVTAFDASGMPLVNANTVPSRHRYWDYRDSYAWTDQTRYRFFHLADEF